jgi:hypothetical protein
MIEETNNTNGQNTTLSHEMIAKEEQNIAIFFAAFSIQYYLHKNLLQKEIFYPDYLKYYNDIKTFASQRIFIKNLIADKQYQEICSNLENTLLQNKESFPHHFFLSKINKANKIFYIRQIFSHSNQILKKYQFFSIFDKKSSIDLKKLYPFLEPLSIDEQILCLTRIYMNIEDSFIEKQKTIFQSFYENFQRCVLELEKNNKLFKKINTNNLETIRLFFKNHKN